MIIVREELWGRISYNTEDHQFICDYRPHGNLQPYVSKPLVLNCYLTYDCNMICDHCVAKDMMLFENGDLKITHNLIDNINNSPFMIIVLSGGEPLLPSKDAKLLEIINGVKNKGLMIDTNGTIKPSNTILKAIKQKDILVRVSLDSVRPDDEICLRKIHRKKERNAEAYFQKLDLINCLINENIKVAIQSVLHKRNSKSIYDIPKKLRSWNIKHWYIQRLIPTSRLNPFNPNDNRSYFLDNEDYETILSELGKEAFKYSIRCAMKRDRRHNCVFLMVNDGQLYTSSDSSESRIYLGPLNEKLDYFSFVSSSEHSARYYSIEDKI